MSTKLTWQIFAFNNPNLSNNQLSSICELTDWSTYRWVCRLGRLVGIGR